MGLVKITKIILILQFKFINSINEKEYYYIIYSSYFIVKLFAKRIGVHNL